MTDREKAIVMAYTGICMLTGDKIPIFHKYVEDLMGEPIWTHEIAFFADAIKEKSKADFIALCADEASLENSNKWIPVSERLPEPYQRCLFTVERPRWENEPVEYIVIVKAYGGERDFTAWMPLPEPYKAESEEQE